MTALMRYFYKLQLQVTVTSYSAHLKSRFVTHVNQTNKITLLCKLSNNITVLQKSKRKRTPSPTISTPTSIKKKVKNTKAKGRKDATDPTKDFPDPVPEVQLEKVASPSGPGPVKGGHYTEIGKGKITGGEVQVSIVLQDLLCICCIAECLLFGSL